MKNKDLLTAIILISIIFSSISNSYSQYGTIKGKVVDKDTKEALAFATVVIEAGGKQFAGTTTDEKGVYLIKHIKPGTYDLKATYVGYSPFLMKGIKIISNKITFQDIEIKSLNIELKEVEISWKPPLIDKGSVSTSMTMTSESLERLPSRSATGAASMKSTRSSISEETDYRRGTGNSEAGVLTAGQLSDFGKWELWKNIANSELWAYQDDWHIKPMNRYTVEIVFKNGKPVVDCKINLIDKNEKTEWTARTDNTGKAELWAGMFSKTDRTKYSIDAEYKGQHYKLPNITKFSDGINRLEINADCDLPKIADVLFVMDATSSMGDEMSYLKAELYDMIKKVKDNNKELTLNLGCIVYRDNGDEYIVKHSDFSTDINKAIDFIKAQNAGGGGDYEEAVDQALELAIDKIKWSDNAVSRMMFLILDAPPHPEKDKIESVQKSVKLAAEKGIRVIPIGCSGINKSTEYLMRSIAIATNGTYIFLTDHSHVGGSHIKPSTDEYDVMHLNELLLSIFKQYLYFTPCDQNQLNALEDIKDTMYIKNPKIIAHEISNQKLIGKYKDSTPDTNKITIADNTIKPKDVKKDSIIAKADSITNKKDTTDNSFKEEKLSFRSLKYYPNPTKDLLKVEFDGKVKEIYLADISGKLLEKYDTRRMMTLDIDFSNYSTGVYYLKYNLDNKWLSGKVVHIR